MASPPKLLLNPPRVKSCCNWRQRQKKLKLWYCLSIIAFASKTNQGWDGPIQQMQLTLVIWNDLAFLINSILSLEALQTLHTINSSLNLIWKRIGSTFFEHPTFVCTFLSSFSLFFSRVGRVYMRILRKRWAWLMGVRSKHLANLLQRH